jgi:hypothetical protein
MGARSNHAPIDFLRESNLARHILSDPTLESPRRNSAPVSPASSIPNETRGLSLFCAPAGGTGTRPRFGADGGRSYKRAAGKTQKPAGKDVSTTMASAHVLNEADRGVRSPVDDLQNYTDCIIIVRSMNSDSSDLNEPFILGGNGN